MISRQHHKRLNASIAAVPPPRIVSSAHHGACRLLCRDLGKRDLGKRALTWRSVGNQLDCSVPLSYILDMFPMPIAEAVSLQMGSLQIDVRCGEGRLAQAGHMSHLPPFPRHLLLQGGYDIRTVLELLGHGDAATTMIYTHVLNRGPAGMRSPVDGL